MTAKRKLLTIILSFAFVVCLAVSMVFALSATEVSASATALGSRWLKADATAGKNYETRLTVDESAGDFSFVFMGDQQIAISNDTTKRYVDKAYEYIRDNADAMNLKMYVNLGDIFDVVDFKFDGQDLIGSSTYNTSGEAEKYGANRGDSKDETNIYFWQQKEYNIAKRKVLMDANVPSMFVMGNHDYEEMAGTYRVNKTFNEAFPLSIYDGLGAQNVGKPDEKIDKTHYFGGARMDDIEDSYSYFVANGQKYLVMVLGIHPNEDAIKWANEVVAANQDCKVIVCTHAYFQGKANLYEKEQRLWDKFISIHSNIMMVLCGHSWTDGRIIRRLDYGVNGNPIYQFMINTQGEENGGLGVFAQMVFRANGSVDVGYYAPAVDDYASELNPNGNLGRYFMDENQFTFSYGTPADGNWWNDETIKTKVVSAGEVFVGNIFNGLDFDEPYNIYKSTNKRWLANAYAYNNIGILDGKGLYANGGSGYVEYKFDLGKNYVLKDITVKASGQIKEWNGNLGVMEIQVSEDNENWIIAHTMTSEVAVLETEYSLKHLLNNLNDLYLRVCLKGDENTYISTLELSVDVVQTVFEGDELNVSLNIKDGSVNSDNYTDGMINSYDAMYTNTAISAGDAYDHHGGTGELFYRFDAGEDRTFKTLNFSAKMFEQWLADFDYTERIITAEERKAIDGIEEQVVLSGGHYTIGWKDSTLGYTLLIEVSTDGGNTFVQASRIENTFDPIDKTNYKQSRSINVNEDLSSFVENQKSVIIRLAYHGLSYGANGFENLSFTGTYNTSHDYPTFVNNGGVAYGSDKTVLDRDGYEFEGWHLDSPTGELVNPEDYKTQNVTLYAGWKKIVNVVYVLDGGTNNSENKAVVYEGETLTLAEPVKDGYKFIGWWGTDNTWKHSIVVGNRPIVLYAIWYSLT